MAPWYPTQERAEAISAELQKLKVIDGELTDKPGPFLLKLSRALMSAANIHGFPQHQTGRWVWLASQFRILTQSRDVMAVDAAAALQFLLRQLEHQSLNEQHVQDLNWVLDSTISELKGRLQPDIRRSNLSAHELIAIEARLAHLAEAPFDAGKIRADIQRQLDDLSRVPSDSHTVSVHEKIERLFAASVLAEDQGRVAREALLYLAEEDDVVADGLGVLGLVDDLYVLNWAFALVTHQTRCIPILEAFLEKWPFVADLALLGNPSSQLDLYGQYIACVCLDRLFESSGPSLIVLRETAGFSTICALMAALQCVRVHADGLERELSEWPLNQAVVIGDGVQHFNALFCGIKSIGGKRKIWLGVGNAGKISVDDVLKSYIALRSTNEKKLSDGHKILSWLKSRHLDPLVGLIGSGRRSLEKQDCLLLLCPRHKIDHYFNEMYPFGFSAAALVGAKYVSSSFVLQEIHGEANDTPFIYSCSDPEVAAELLKKPPAHVSGWKVLVDGARAGQKLQATIRNSQGLQHIPICILAELHEREAASELEKSGVAAWFLESEDVQLPSLEPMSSNTRVDALTRSIRRQGRHSAQELRVTAIESEFLERLTQCLRDRVGSELGGSQIDSLDMAVSSFLQRAIDRPLWDQSAALDLNKSANRIASFASTLSQYEERAGRYLDLFRNYTDDTAIQFDRSGALRSLIVKGSGDAVVVCRSMRVAETSREMSRGISDLKDVTWTTIAGLRVDAPFDRVIVPGWLDRISMREIADNGFGKEVSLLLFPFEERWFNATMAANRQWERKLKAKTAGLMRNLPIVQALKKKDRSLWRQQLEERIRDLGMTDEPEESSREIDVPEFAQLESRAIASLKQQLGSIRAVQATAKAQLVLFEEEGAYAFLPPEGKVIVLPEAGARASGPRIIRGGAESLLFRSVTSLKPGMVLAFSKGSDRDLVDARADQFIQNAEVVRATADLWKRSLKNKLTHDWSNYVDFSNKMGAAGHSRSADTVRSWATNTNSVAPRNYREVVPLIAKLTEDAELTRRVSDVLAAIDLVYRARAKAAEAIVSDLFSGEIDPSARELSFEIDGTLVRYSLHRIRRTAGMQSVPVDLIGKVQTLDDLVIAKSDSPKEMPLQ